MTDIVSLADIPNKIAFANVHVDYVNVVVGDLQLDDTVCDTLSVTSSTLPTNVDIISDSGATRHMFCDRTMLSEYREVVNHFVRVANGKLVSVAGIGKVGPLNNVLHVPSLVLCLVSEPQLDNEGKICITFNGVKSFYDDMSQSTASLFLVATLSPKGLYVVNPTYLNLPNPSYNYTCYDALATKAEAIDLLHRTYGHVSVDRLQDCVVTGHVRWEHESKPKRFRKISNPCGVCELAKSKRASHKGTIKTPMEPAELVYVDVWGPCEEGSLMNDNKYTIGFIDAATKRA